MTNYNIMIIFIFYFVGISLGYYLSLCLAIGYRFPVVNIFAFSKDRPLMFIINNLRVVATIH